MIRKVRQHINQNESLLFEISSPGKRGYQLPPLDVPPVDAEAALGAGRVRSGIDGFPEVSEVEAIRHFTRLSTHNYAIDLGLYPLGSCTMKYNPRVNELVARIDGLAWAHPYQPESLSQGCLKIIAALEAALAEITGMAAVTLQPAAGAHGELTGILLIRALLESRGDPRRKVLVPDSAHGTNPATAAMAGYAVENIASNASGMIDLAALERAVDGSVAALMVTNPNTLGVFEQDIIRAAEVLHARGALMYMDGANMNALVGLSRPGDFGVDVMHLNLHKTFSTPHGGGGPGSGAVAVKQHLEPFLPLPRLARRDGAWTFSSDRPQSIGRVRAFCGNFGVLVRALAYVMAHGGDGLRRATLDAILNCNYIRKNLEPYYQIHASAPSMHECVFSDDRQASRGVRTGDESKQELDLFIDALISIAEEAEQSPELVTSAPHNTRTSRVDETTAARKPILRWRPEA
jgi:glycine dehydrogenase subunit 2